MTTYLLDTNVFVEAKRHYCGFSSYKNFLKWIDHMNSSKIIFSVKKVLEEINSYKGEDYLSKWAKKHSSIFLDINPTILEKTMSVVEWARRDGYEKSAIDEFTKCADCYLVGHAIVMKSTVVTQELGGQRSSVKIPDACEKFGVNFMNVDKLVCIESKDINLKKYRGADFEKKSQRDMFK